MPTSTEMHQPMKKRYFNILLLITSLFGYLEWGTDQHEFLFQIEYELLFNIGFNPDNFTHPFILLPMLGQLFLIITLFQKEPSRILTLGGLACLSVIMLMILLAGSLSLNARMILSTLPFLLTGIFVIRQFIPKRT